MYTPGKVKALKDEINLNVVLGELRKDIEEQLEKLGLYFRIFSRVKTDDSLAEKLNNGEYGAGQKKVQDLLGIRIVLYYSDDLLICRQIMEKTFTRNGEWSQNDLGINEFQATKINGVFEIPQRLLELVDEDTWKLPVDATFEVQIRTVLFEGWHEIEHDMRYKDYRNNKKNLWDDNENLARTMNSILASLELCDWSLSSLFQTLARNHMEKKNWERMLRCRYRLRLGDKPLNPEVFKYLNNHEDVAARLFECDKQELITALMDENVHTRLNFDVLVKVLNMVYIKDETLEQLLADTKLRVYDPAPKKSALMPLENRTTFKLDVALNGEAESDEKTLADFQEASEIIYGWCRYKYRNIFSDMPEGPCCYDGTLPGYSLKAIYHPEKQQFYLNLSRIDAEMPGTIWYTETSLEKKNGRLLFFCIASVSAQEAEIAKVSFKKPKFVDRIWEKMDFYDVEKVPKKLKVLESAEDEQFVRRLMEHPGRSLPVIVAGFDEAEDRYLIQTEKLISTIGSFAHVYAQKSSKDGSLMIFWPDGSYQLFDREMIKNSRFDYNRKVFADDEVYEIPFRHRIVNLVRERNNGIIRQNKDLAE